MKEFPLRILLSFTISNKILAEYFNLKHKLNFKVHLQTVDMNHSVIVTTMFVSDTEIFSFHVSYIYLLIPEDKVMFIIFDLN